MSLVLNVGKPSSGKTYNMVFHFERIVKRNARWYRKKKIKYIRKAFINQKYISEKFLEKYKDFIIIGQNQEDFIYLENTDIFIDEVSAYWPARDFQNLSMDAIIFFSQYKKRGNFIWSTTQNPGDVDTLFRNKVTKLRYFSKLIGTGDPTPIMPKIRRPWCIFLIQPARYEYDDNGVLELKLSKNPLNYIIMLTEKYIFDIYSRTEKVQQSDLPKLNHYEYYCQHYKNPDYSPESRKKQGKKPLKCFSEAVRISHK